MTILPGMAEWSTITVFNPILVEEIVAAMLAVPPPPTTTSASWEISISQAISIIVFRVSSLFVEVCRR